MHKARVWFHRAFPPLGQGSRGTTFTWARFNHPNPLVADFDSTTASASRKGGQQTRLTPFCQNPIPVPIAWTQTLRTWPSRTWRHQPRGSLCKTMWALNGKELRQCPAKTDALCPDRSRPVPQFPVFTHTHKSITHDSSGTSPPSSPVGGKGGSAFVLCGSSSTFTPPLPAYRNPTPHIPYTLLRVGFRPTIAPGLKAKGVALAVSEFFSTPLPFGHKCVGGTQNWFTLLLGALFPHGPPFPSRPSSTLPSPPSTIYVKRTTATLL